MARPGNGVSLEQVAERIDGMARWASKVNKQLNGVDVAALWTEADQLREKYDTVPSELHELERSKAEKEFELVSLEERYVLIEDQATMEAEGSNKEKRSAYVRQRLANDEKAVEMASHISQLEFEIKLVEAEIQEKERVWSDYHRQTIILAAKAGITYR